MPDIAFRAGAVPDTSSQKRFTERWQQAPWRWALLVWVSSLVLIFSRSMHADLDVDEHPFVASAAVMARHGMLPYRDYHYNHMPTEVMIYAGLFRVCSHLVLAARSFQVLCAATAAAVLFCVAHAALTFLSPAARRALSAAAAALLVANPLFFKTAGLCWNHDFPLLTALLGFVALRRAVAPSRGAVPLAILSGFLLGLSVTTRLTFAAAAPGFAALIFLSPGLTRRQKAGLIAALAAGFGIASLPAAWVWAQAPRAALFGNFLYPSLNTRIHELRDQHHRFTVFPILLYYLQNLVYLPGNGMVTIAFVALAARAIIRRAEVGRRARAEIWAIVVVAGGLLASGFMPAPPFPQYFYAATPFMILGTIICVSAMPDLLRRMWVCRVAVGAWIVCIAFGAAAYRGVAYLPRPGTWVPLTAHRIGQDVASKARAAEVLTLEPIFPLEGGLDVDERLTTCRFGLRVAAMLEPRDRAEYRMPTPMDIPFLLHERHAAVLVIKGTDRRLDAVLERAAADAGYEKLPLRPRGRLWRPAQSSTPTQPAAR